MKKLPAISLLAISTLATSFLIYAFINLAWNGFIADSEIWSVTVGKNFGEEWYQPWVFSRLFFYGPLALVTAPFSTATSIFHAAKVLMVINGLFILFFAYRLARRICRAEGIGIVTPWLAVILILANTGFLNQGYRIRSDLISCTFVLLALEITFRAKGRLSGAQLLYWVLPFLATPKAAIHVFPAIGLVENQKDRRRILLIFFVGFFATILVYPSAIPFFLNTYTDPEAGTGFFSPERFVYLGRIISNNGVIVCLFAFRFVTWFIRLRIGAFESERQQAIQRGFGYFVLGSMAVLILSPEKVPFFVASFLPVFSVFASLLVDDILAILDKESPAARRRSQLLLLLVSIHVMVSAITVRAGLNWIAFRENNGSHIQLTLAQIIEAYLNKYPKATYYDVVGMVPQKATIRLFAGPNDPVNNHNSFLALEDFYRPDLVFQVRKMRYLQPGIGKMLDRDYFTIGSNAHARWHRFPEPLKLPLKSRQDLAEVMDFMKNWSGAPFLPEFTVLIETKGRPNRTLQISEADLLSAKKMGARSRLLAVSPFIQIDRLTDMLPVVIRFDWDWTGVADEIDMPTDAPFP